MATKPIGPTMKGALLQFRVRTSEPDMPELELPMAPTKGLTIAATRPPAMDLAGKPKIWFIDGRGRIGKTTLARWVAETIQDTGGQLVCAAADPVNRSLRSYLDGVEEPPTNDAADVAQWLQELLHFSIQQKASALIDLGGGDTSLLRLLRTMPDLVAVMDGEGVAPVAVHVIGSDPHDLVPMATMEAAGFQPQATLLVLNEITGSRDQFEPVIRHSAYQAALARGAVQVWMPPLAPATARAIDAKRLHFHQVGNALGPFNGAAVRAWLAQMAEAFEPVKTWLPR